MAGLEEFPELRAMTERFYRQLGIAHGTLNSTDNSNTEISQEEYKHLADRTLLPPLQKLIELIEKFRSYLEETPNNIVVEDGERIENIRRIIEYFNDNMAGQLTYLLRFKIGYVNNFNNEEGNVLVSQLFSEIEELLNYYAKQSTKFDVFYETGDFSMRNAIHFGVDLAIRDNSIKLCDNIMSFILILKDYIETQFPLTSLEAKGRKKNRKRCKNGTRKNKKTGKCEKTKSKSKKSKSKKSKSNMKNKKISTKTLKKNLSLIDKLRDCQSKHCSQHLWGSRSYVKCSKTHCKKVQDILLKNLKK